MTTGKARRLQVKPPALISLACVVSAFLKFPTCAGDPRYLLIFRNVLHAKFCPVVNLIGTMYITKWEKGPIFGNLDRNGHLLRAHREVEVQVGSERHKIWMAEEVSAVAGVPGTADQPATPAVAAVQSRRVNFTAAQVGARSERLFDAVGLFEVHD